MTDSSSDAGASSRIHDYRTFAAWLRTQPRELNEAIATRAALRALPLLASGYGGGLDTVQARLWVQLIGATFRATAKSWVAAKFSWRASDGNAAAAALGAGSTASAIHAVAKGGASAAADIAAFAANSADPRLGAADYAHSAAAAAASVAIADDRLWFASLADVGIVSESSTSELLDKPLWADKVPDWFDENRQRLRDILTREPHWGVWLDWYRMRIKGCSRPELIELVYARTPQELWDNPERENEWIAAEIAKSQSDLPRAIEGVPSPFTYGWTGEAKLTIVAGPQNLPVFPYSTSEQDHAQYLEACRKQVERLLGDLCVGRVNARIEYREALKRYAEDLPPEPGAGNFMLADAEARILRDMFDAEAEILSVAFASRLRAFLVQHIGLRGFYPEVERFYCAVLRGRLERPLPLDAVEAFERVVCDNTPGLFAPEVSSGLRQAEIQAPPIITISSEDVHSHSTGQPLPPPDPFGELDPQKSRSFTIASSLNALWKAFREGEKIEKNEAAWENVAERLSPIAGKILDWLNRFFDEAS